VAVVDFLPAMWCPVLDGEPIRNFTENIDCSVKETLTFALRWGPLRAFLSPTMSERYVTDPEKVLKAEEAGRLAAFYATPDPVHWIDRAAQAGVTFGLLDEGGFWSCFLEADMEEASFLDAWLHATPGAAAAVEQLLRQRGVLSM
jgi:hypothetical protein